MVINHANKDNYIRFFIVNLATRTYEHPRRYAGGQKIVPKCFLISFSIYYQYETILSNLAVLTLVVIVVGRPRRSRNCHTRVRLE